VLAGNGTDVPDFDSGVRNDEASAKKRSDGLDETDFWIACTADAGLGPVLTADLLAAIFERVSRALSRCRTKSAKSLRLA
jgi:predicted nucleic acid-binding protein